MDPTKIAFLTILGITGLLILCQSIAIGQEQESRAQNRESLVPEGAHTTERAASIEAQRTNDSESAERLALDELRNAVEADPLKAPDIVARSIRTDVPHPIPMSCEIVRAAILAMGKKATRLLVARIVYAAVKERPSEALYTVCVAIQATTNPFHSHIVHAAIAAEPDANARVPQTSTKYQPCDCPSRAELYEGITLAEATYEEAILAGATAYELDYYPVSGATETEQENDATGEIDATGVLSDAQINKGLPPTPPRAPTPTPTPRPSPVSPPTPTPRKPPPTPPPVSP